MIFNHFNKIYHRYFYCKQLHLGLKGLWKNIIDIWANWRGFYFPKNYSTQQKAVMLFGWYEKETALVFKKIIKPGMVVVDIGAHVGYYTKLFAKLVGPTGGVYAFEADPENYQLLVKNTAPLKNVKIFPIALTDRVGPIDFYESVIKSGCHSLVLGAVPDQRKISVPGSDLDSILAQSAVAYVDIIKMDIEGGEPLAIKGMSGVLANNSALILVTELSARRLKLSGVTPSAYLRSLAQFGFNLSIIKSDGLFPLNLSEEETDKLLNTLDPTNIFCSKQTPAGSVPPA